MTNSHFKLKSYTLQLRMKIERTQQVSKSKQLTLSQKKAHQKKTHLVRVLN